jgi:hypothetical protein
MAVSRGRERRIQVARGGVRAWTRLRTGGLLVAVLLTGVGTYRLGSPAGASSSSSARLFSLPGDLNGLVAASGGALWASISPKGTGGAPSAGGSVVLLSQDGRLLRELRAPFTFGQMALFGDDLYDVARTGTNYTNWQTSLLRISLPSGATFRFAYTAGPTGPGGVVVEGRGAPIYLGLSQIGGPYGIPVVMELSPATGRFVPRNVASPQGGYVGGLAGAQGTGVWGIVPKSAEVFLLPGPTARFRTWEAPGPTTPVSLDGIVTAGPTAFAAVSGAAPGTVGVFSVNATTGATSWLEAPRGIVSISGMALDGGLWVGAVSAGGIGGVLHYAPSGWRFVPVFAHVGPSQHLLLASGGPGALWLGEAGGQRLWRVPTSAVTPTSASGARARRKEALRPFAWRPTGRASKV